LNRPLSVGDSITIDIVEAKRVDKPKRRYPEDSKMVERAKRRYFERLKKEFEAIIVSMLLRFFCHKFFQGPGVLTR
jgi:hypothetical protein